MMHSHAESLAAVRAHMPEEAETARLSSLFKVFGDSTRMRILLALSAHATGSNAVQVAFGQDANGDEDLEPEETQLVVGVDCGEWFARDERPGSPRPLVLEDWVSDPSSTNALRAIRIRQAASVPERFDFAKVTVRGVDDPAAEIAAEITRPGIALMIR